MEVTWTGVLAVLLLAAVAASPEADKVEEETSVDIKLAEQESCKDDLEVLKDVCKKSTADLTNNWVFLDCIDSIPEGKQLSSKCETTVWNFKLKVSQREVFLEQAMEVCKEDKELVQECQGQEKGHQLACMVELRGKVKDLQCGQFLGQVERIIFSDWRIISSFMKTCESDVVKLSCGSMKRREGQMHSQEDTISCLMHNMENVTPSCRKEILLIAELQADDYHLDRELYLACKGDREQVCPNIQSGEGRVYHCLTMAKDKVSPPCQVQLSKRQALAAQDFKADASLLDTCSEELTRLQCGVQGPGEGAVRLSQVLLCLEGHLRDGQKVGGRCVEEMREIRRTLMEDFSVTPELVTSCSREIKQFCTQEQMGPKQQGQTVHCLMKTAIEEDRKREGQDPADEQFGLQCKNALNTLLSEAQASSDWKADPVLEDACEDVVFAACDPKQGGDAVMSCLMEQLSRGGPAMTTECGEVLMQIHYFLAREVMLDDHLYKACKIDAEKVCGAKPGWQKSEEDSRHVLVFPCLVRNLYSDDMDEEGDNEDDDNDEGESKKKGKDLLSDKCTAEVERTLQQRAISVQLQPEVEEACRPQLHSLCAKHVGPGEELLCLQDNYQNLDPECQKLVAQLTKLESRNPYLHPIVTKACGKVVERVCGQEDKAADGAGVMECLIRHKMAHPAHSPGAMNMKCRTVVEHWQIITLQDWTFSFKFKEACKGDIREHCVNPRPKKKADVISCLVMMISNDTVNEDRHRIKKGCRQELKYELLAQHSDIRLNPKLEEACRDEILKCSPGDEEGVVECLKGLKHKEMSRVCRAQLFQEEEEEAEDTEVDFTLMRGCKREIQQHCPDERADNLLHCLKDFSKVDGNFEQTCLAVIKRRTVQRMKDYRLNPNLRKACKQDIPKFCGDLLAGKNRASEDFFEGKVIECLKERVIQKDKKLTDQCHHEIIGLMEEVAPVIEADPVLEESCINSIAHCRAQPEVKSGLEVHECLKQMFESQKLADGKACNRHIALIIEGASADINVDPVLHSACSLDLQKFCRDVQQGEGKLLACLVGASRVSSFTLEPECEALLARRVAMYDIAIKVAPMESAAELYHSVMKSQHRNTFLSVGLIFLAIIFTFGLCFGRVTRRLQGEMKNR